MRADPNGVRGPLGELVGARRLALLIYDMQVGVVSQITDGTAVTTRVAQVRAAARAAGVPTFFTRHTSLPVNLLGGAGVRTAMTWQRTDRVDELVSPFPPGAAHTQVVPDLTPGPDEAVFDKLAMSAFTGTPLDPVWRDLGITSFAIVGVALEVGIEPTIRHGLDLGYLPVLITDACGHGNAEAAARTLAQLDWFGGTLQIDSETFLHLLDTSKG